MNIILKILSFKDKLMKNLAELDPALARAVEIAIYSVLAFLLQSLLSGNFNISINSIITIVTVPFLAYIAKIKRDLDKKINDEVNKRDNS